MVIGGKLNEKQTSVCQLHDGGGWTVREELKHKTQEPEMHMWAFIHSQTLSICIISCMNKVKRYLIGTLFTVFTMCRSFAGFQYHSCFHF